VVLEYDDTGEGRVSIERASVQDRWLSRGVGCGARRYGLASDIRCSSVPQPCNTRRSHFDARDPSVDLFSLHYDGVSVFLWSMRGFDTCSDLWRVCECRRANGQWSVIRRYWQELITIASAIDLLLDGRYVTSAWSTLRVRSRRRRTVSGFVSDNRPASTATSPSHHYRTGETLRPSKNDVRGNGRGMFRVCNVFYFLNSIVCPSISLIED